MHRDISTELEPATAEQAALDLWRQEFNEERPHEALGMKCPAEIYQTSSRAYAGTPADVTYPGMDSRRVIRRGTITCGGERLFITTSLSGWSVGLKPLVDQRRELWFGRLILGWVEPATASFQRAVIHTLNDGN